MTSVDLSRGTNALSTTVPGRKKGRGYTIVTAVGDHHAHHSRGIEGAAWVRERGRVCMWGISIFQQLQTRAEGRERSVTESVNARNNKKFRSFIRVFPPEVRSAPLLGLCISRCSRKGSHHRGTRREGQESDNRGENSWKVTIDFRKLRNEIDQPRPEPFHFPHPPRCPPPPSLTLSTSKDLRTHAHILQDPRGY